ncbi:toxin-antitoxin system HicB family antitoxin [Pectobacterium versatile]|nr:toxin-antitoxin system HicB family antitoxin [Pectobacterium versatile]AZK62371.1 toxin-antitoxin system HicB family antitoxin [Pectobacterium versatile]
MGKSPTFQIYIVSELREKLGETAGNVGMSLDSLFKKLAQRRLGIEVKR